MTMVVNPFMFAVAGGGGVLPTATLEFDHSGIDLTGADDDVITNWDDSSAADNDLTDSFSSNRPVKKTDILNGHPVCRYVNGNILTLETPLSVASLTYFAVMKATVGGTDRTLISGPAGSLQIRINSSNKIQVLKRATAGIGESTTALSTGTFFTIAVTYNGTNVAFYVNEVADGTASSAQTFTDTLRWQGNTTAGEGFTGDIARELFYSSVLSAPDLATVFAILKAEWAHYA